MKKILTFGITILLLNLCVLAGLVGYVVATDRLDSAKWHTILDLLRKPGTPEGLRAKVADILAPATAPAPAAPPATMSALAENGTLPASAAASAAERIQYAQQAIEQERLRLDRAAQDLLQRQKLLETQRADMVAKLARLEEERTAFQKQVKTTQDQTKNESFTRTLAMYNDLKPKQVKDLFLGLPEDVMASYLVAMEPEQATKIISEFKSPAEREVIAKVLEKIRANGTGSAPSPATLPANAPISAPEGGATRN